MNTTQNSTKSKIVKVIGVDLAKDHCDVIGYDENGKICLRLDGCSYAKLREILSNLPQAVVLMEACKGSMFHARSIADLGHEVRLVKGADVKALRNVNHKNDLRDAAYIAKLYFVPGTTYVYIKSQQQQSLQFLQNEYKSLQEWECQDFCVWGGYSRGSPTRLPFVFEMQYARPDAIAGAKVEGPARSAGGSSLAPAIARREAAGALAREV